MASTIFNKFKQKNMDGGVDLDGHTVKCALMGPGYTPDQDAHEDWADVSSYEISGTGYTAGGAALANTSVTQDNTNDRGVFDADDVQWPSATFGPAYGAMVYDDSASPKYLICYIEFTTPQYASGGNFNIQWNGVGILSFG